MARTKKRKSSKAPQEAEPNAVSRVLVRLAIVRARQLSVLLFPRQQVFRDQAAHVEPGRFASRAPLLLPRDGKEVADDEIVSRLRARRRFVYLRRRP